MTPLSDSYAHRTAELAATSPEQVAIHFAAIDGTDRHVTWAELHRRTNQLARALAERGLGLGDRIAIGLRNSPELVDVTIAAWKLGATPVPVRWDLPDWERGRVLDAIDAKVAVDGDDLEWIAASASLDDGDLPDAVAPQTHGICSSGSTGTPKVILTDRPGVVSANVGPPFPSGWMDVPRPQVVLVPGPLYHTNGFFGLYNLLAGDTVVILERYDAARAVELIEKYRVTTFTATPTMLQRMAAVADIDERDLSSLVWVLQGAAAMPPTLTERWIDLIGAEKLFMAYGMSEGLGLAAIRGDEWLTHPGSVGRGYRGTEIRILDTAGNDLPTGEVGEIYLRSPSSGQYQYHGADPLPMTDDGFGSAGDLGWLDDEGFLYIADRRVDLIVSGGANVYPAEVESALIDHPDVADVAVIGLSDPEWGRRVHALIEPVDPGNPPTAGEIVGFAKRRLAPYKVPKTVEIVERIPRSEATKVSRTALVEERGG